MYKYQLFWDRISNTYANKPILQPSAFTAMVENIRRHVTERDQVLDFGCGTGTYSIAIADKVDAIYAIDISEKMLAIAGQRAQQRDLANITFAHQELFDPSLQPNSFTVVLCFNILHLQPDLSKTLHRIHQLLTPGGLLISKTVCLGEKFSWMAWLMKPFSKLGLLPYIRCFSSAQLQAYLVQHQLNIVETKTSETDAKEYFIVAQK